LKVPFPEKVVIYDNYSLTILLIWLLKSTYSNNTYFYEHYLAGFEGFTSRLHKQASQAGFTSGLHKQASQAGFTSRLHKQASLEGFTSRLH